MPLLLISLMYDLSSIEIYLCKTIFSDADRHFCDLKIINRLINYIIIIILFHIILLVVKTHKSILMYLKML